MPTTDTHSKIHLSTHEIIALVLLCILALVVFLYSTQRGHPYSKPHTPPSVVTDNCSGGTHVAVQDSQGNITDYICQP